MTTFTNSPRLLRGGIVVLDPASGDLRRIVALQYNPDSVTRSLQPQAFASGDGGDRSEALRLKGPPTETIRLEAEVDAADQLEHPDRHPTAARHGLQPFLAALEVLVYPASAQIERNRRLAENGTLEIIPAEAPLTLLVWGTSRVTPVRITELSVTEEAFDPNLNPTRARISLGLRVLSVSDLGFDHRGGDLYMAYQREKERLAGLSRSAGFGDIGIGGL